VPRTVVDREHRTVQINAESADFEHSDWWLVVEELANLGATLQDSERTYRDGVLRDEPGVTGEVS